MTVQKPKQRLLEQSVEECVRDPPPYQVLWSQ